jgi:hypothetical protein
MKRTYLDFLAPASRAARHAILLLLLDLLDLTRARRSSPGRSVVRGESSRQLFRNLLICLICLGLLLLLRDVRQVGLGLLGLGLLCRKRVRRG